MDATGSSKSGLLFLLCWGCGAGLGALPMPGAAPFEVFCFLVGCSMARGCVGGFLVLVQMAGGKMSTKAEATVRISEQGMTRPLVKTKRTFCKTNNSVNMKTIPLFYEQARRSYNKGTSNMGQQQTHGGKGAKGEAV